MEKITEVNRYCVPIALNAKLLRLDKGEEGQFFRKHFAPRENVTFMATASGQVLSGWGQWTGLPAPERRPGGVKVPRLTTKPAGFEPPPDGLVARVFIRPFVKENKGGLAPEKLLNRGEGRFEAEVGRDHLWMKRAEAESLLPSSPRKGLTFDVPELVRYRIYQHHLPLVTDCVVGPWPLDAFRSAGLRGTVEEVTDARLTVRLNGEAVIGHPGSQPLAKTTDGYEARVWGNVEYDRKKKQFTGFSLLVFGNAWESNGNRPRKSPGVERRWIGIAMELVRPDAKGNWPGVTPPHTLTRDGGVYFN